MSINVGIIGCGINGLACGLILQEKLKNFKVRVTIHAEHYTPNITSDIAAGFIFPYSLNETPVHLIEKWTHSTIDYLIELRNQNSHLHPHIFDVLNITLYKLKCNEKSLSSIMPNFQHLSQRQITNFPKFREGTIYSTQIVDVKYLLTYFMKRFTDNGGILLQDKIMDINEFQMKNNYQIVINCAGLGNMELMNDHNMFPIRGQIHLLYASWIKCVYLNAERNGYIVPQSDGHVVIGGTTQKNDFYSQIRETDKLDIIEKCSEIFPELANCNVVESRVGFRPGRNCVRIESEIFKIQGRSEYLLVHNYGHGGAGWSIFWGCALDVLSSVEDYLNRFEAKI